MERHSETGLMKERWAKPGIAAMWKARLRFTPDEAALILAPVK